MTHLENHHRTVGKGPSKMAEGMALHRTAESMLPEGDRICYDPYAVHFVNPEILKFAEAHRPSPPLVGIGKKYKEDAIARIISEGSGRMPAPQTRNGHDLSPGAVDRTVRSASEVQVRDFVQVT